MAALDTIVVNWNAGGDLRACLASIAVAERAGFALARVVVVDNASTDGSADALPGFDLPLTVLHNRRNRGFGAACNQGAAGSDADYLLFLNPDVRLGRESLSRAIAFMERPQSARIGICGVQLLDEEGEVGRTCARFPTPALVFARMLGLDRCLPGFFASQAMTEWDHRESREVDQVMGAMFLVRRSLFEALGGFDERFFVYFEEVDFSYRARRAGWSSYYLADGQAYHRGRGSSDQVKAARLFYYLRSRIRYGHKHFPRPVAIGLGLGTLLLEPVVRLALAAGRGSPRELREVLAGYARLWSAAPALLAGRGGVG